MPSTALKHTVFSVVLAAASLQAHACNFNWATASNNVIRVIKNKNSDGWTFKNYEAICKKLTAANAALLIHGEATVLGNKSIVWANVSIKDKDLSVIAPDFHSSNTRAVDYASQDKADELLWRSMNTAIEDMQIDKAIAQLNLYREQTKNAYRKQSSR